MEEIRATNLDLQEAIIRMVVFFDLFDSPLTAYEIYNNLKQRWSLVDIYYVLDNKEGIASFPLDSFQGFYFLKGRSSIIKVRMEHYHHFYRKLKISRHFSAIFKLFPAVEMIALANVIGSYNLRDNGDIDFLIVTKPRRLWLSRLFCTGLAKLLHSRPTKNTKRDKICLSFYLSTDSLNLDRLRLGQSDPYLDYWPGQLVLLYNNHQTYESFCFSNRLLEKESNGFDRLLDIKQDKLRQTVFTWVDRLDKAAGALQWRIMPVVLKEAAVKREGVVIDQHILKFYLRDRRYEFAQKYEQKIQDIFS